MKKICDISVSYFIVGNRGLPWFMFFAFLVKKTYLEKKKKYSGSFLNQKSKKKKKSLLLASLFRRQFDVILHPDVNHVPGGADKPPACPRKAGYQHPLVERNIFAPSAKPLLANLQQAFAHTNVDIIMENIESSWNILMDINFKILQSKYFNDWNFWILFDRLVIFHLKCLRVIPKSIQSVLQKINTRKTSVEMQVYHFFSNCNHYYDTIHYYDASCP